MTPAREWNARSYDGIAAPMTLRGVELVDRLELRGDETVLDAGCGTGHVTARLLERLPAGRVIALDGSREMLDVAAERLGHDRVAYVHADLGEPLPLPLGQRVDGIISTSTFHWVDDHGALFTHLAAVLAPGGFLVSESGGEGNIAAVQAILTELGYESNAWRYPSVEATRERLTAAGFTDLAVRLVDRLAQIPAEDLREYLRTVVLGAHVERHGDGVVEAVASRMAEPVLGYVRLMIDARRAT